MNDLKPCGFAFLVTAILCGSPASQGAQTTFTVCDRRAERTSFQTASAFTRDVDIRSDVAMVYGVDDTITSRAAGYRDQGYVVQCMTGSAWGQYEDYIDGRFDGAKHADEGQVDPQGNVIWHHPGVPYMVPTPSFVKYLCSLSEKAIDAGCEALHLEEPEFWSRAGYSEGFKKLWKAEYNEEWSRPDSSPDAFWRSSKLKYLLYKRTLEQVFAHAVKYAASRGRTLKCYVPTHSLVNYAQWGIVSPESSLMDLANCDGYIAQVWTGTARTQNRYRGVTRERTFESAFLEYSCMHQMTAASGRRVYFLADPVEDDPNHSWDDYRANYERVVAASLLFPGVSDFEVMPWPDRVLSGRYPAGAYQQDSPTSAIRIPQSYAQELMTVINALNEMHQDDNRWEAGSDNIALLLADTMMFQRGSQWSGSGLFSEFFGLAMPLVKHGIPVKGIILERILDRDALKDTTALLMSYEHMKPLKAEYHGRLAEWVRGGGVLLYFGNDADKFHHVREWWNQEGATTVTARQHLFSKLEIKDEAGMHPCGKGMVCYIDTNPAEFAEVKHGDKAVLGSLKSAMSLVKRGLKTSNRLVLHRGPYTIGGVPDEAENPRPVALDGHYLDLYTPDLDEKRNPTFNQGQVFLLRRIPAKSASAVPQVLASSYRVEEVSGSTTGPVTLRLSGCGTLEHGRLCMTLPFRPGQITCDNPTVKPSLEWSDSSHLTRIRWSGDKGRISLVIQPYSTTTPGL